MTASAHAPAITPARIQQFTWSYAPPLIVQSALELGIFDLLHQTPLDASELVEKTRACSRGLERLLSALICLDLCNRASDGKYTLTAVATKFLVSSGPEFYGGFFLNIDEMIRPWLGLTESVRTGNPSRALNREDVGAEVYKRSVSTLFPWSLRSAEALGVFLQVPKKAERFRVLDVAAGSGVWGIALAEQSPNVEVTAVDWPKVIPTTKMTVDGHGLTERFSFVEADLGEFTVTESYDLIVLGHVLHAIGKEKSQELLRRVHGFLSPGGVVAIGEYLVNEEKPGPLANVIFALSMLVNTDDGDVFSFGQIAEWLYTAGFTDAQQINSNTPSQIIVARN